VIKWTEGLWRTCCEKSTWSFYDLSGEKCSFYECFFYIC